MDEEIIFEKVSRIEGGIVLPQKSTKFSAGYDFICPEDTFVSNKNIVYVRTGVKVKFPNNMALLLLNRSSNPKKKNLVVMNGVGLVDSDYYNNEDNEGEISFAMLSLDEAGTFIKAGEKLGQGVFIKYYDVTNLNVEQLGKREGGFGSTGN